MNSIDLSSFDILFKNVASELIDEVLMECSVYKVPAGKHLVKKDFKNSALFLLLEGEVEIYLDENDKPLKTILSGDIIGEISLVDQKTATASAISLCDCKVIVIKDDLVWRLVEQSHAFTINLLYLITDRFRGVNSQVLSSIKKQQISERKAIVDDLTQLHNRRWLNQSFSPMLERCKKDRRAFSYMMIDIDHFKKFNDTYGHQAGDFVLQTAATVLNNLSRATDYVVRYGGEEMAMLLPDTGLADALEIAERIRKTIEQNLIECLTGEALNITVSIGVSALTDQESADDLIKLADNALYLAKEQGRNRVAYELGMSR